MTLIISVEGKDFIVLAADSKGTWLDDYGSRMESLTEEKLLLLSKYAYVLIADDAELGVQLVEEFKSKHTAAANWGLTKVVKAFSKFCKKEIKHISDTISPGARDFPSIVFLIGGLDKVASNYVPKINILRSTRLFFPGRKKFTAAEGKPFIARYILSKEYSIELSPTNLCFLVAKAMSETISVDGDVGGRVRMVIIDKNGGREFNEVAVKEFLEGEEKYSENKICEEHKELEKIVKE